MERRRSVQEYVRREVEKDLFRPFRTVNGSSPVLLLTKKTRPAKNMSRVKAIEQGNYREYSPLQHLSIGRFLSTRFRGGLHVVPPCLQAHCGGSSQRQSVYRVSTKRCENARHCGRRSIERLRDLCSVRFARFRVLSRFKLLEQLPRYVFAVAS